MATEVAIDAYGLFDGPSYTEAHFSALTALTRGSGIARGEDNECSPSVSSSNVRVATGKVFVKGFYGTITSNKDVTPTAPHASLTRIDRVVLRLDRSDNEITVGVVTGTASGAPTAPALTQNATIWETRIAAVVVAGGSGALTVVDEREYARGIGEPPAGTIEMWAGTSVPSGYLGCVGTAVLRATYWELFAVCGTAFGAGNGSSTFNLPDLRGRVGVGGDAMLGAGDAGRLSALDSLGEVGGVQTIDPSTSLMAAHTHAGPTYSFVVGSVPTSTLYINSGANIDHGNNTNVSYAAATGSNGSGAASNNMQPFQVVSYIVKV